MDEAPSSQAPQQRRARAAITWPAHATKAMRSLLGWRRVRRGQGLTTGGDGTNRVHAKGRVRGARTCRYWTCSRHGRGRSRRWGQASQASGPRTEGHVRAKEPCMKAGLSSRAGREAAPARRRRRAGASKRTKTAVANYSLPAGKPPLARLQGSCYVGPRHVCFGTRTIALSEGFLGMAQLVSGTRLVVAA